MKGARNMSEKSIREIFEEEFGTPHPSELFNNIALRILNIEKVLALVSTTLGEIVVEKKIMTQEEFDQMLERISKKIDKQFEEFLKQVAKAAAPNVSKDDNKLN